MMTDDEIMAVVSAHKAGKRIEWEDARGAWSACHAAPSWDFRHTNYRVAPEPKLRPWRESEVPIGAIVRSKTCPENRVMITAVWDGRVKLGLLGSEWPDDAFEHREHSIDGGKTWQPCGVLEGEA